MKDSKEKEHRISNLRNMISNVKDDNEKEYAEMEEDSELIDYLNEDTVDYDDLEIDDEFIYRPGDEEDYAVNLEENPIDEDFIIKTPKAKDIEDNDGDDADELNEDIVGEFSENFDTVINAKIGGKPILAIISSIVGVLLIIISIFIFQSRSDRIIDNVVAGETNFMFVIFLIFGLLLLIYGIYKLFDIKNPLDSLTKSIDSIEDDEDKQDDNTKTKKEKPSPKVIPKSEIPLDKESYKIGEFDANDLKTTLKKPTASKNKPKMNESMEDIPDAKEKPSDKKGLTDAEIENMEYEKAKLETESIDDIFAEAEDIEDISIISINSEEKE